MSILFEWGAGVAFILLALGIVFSAQYVYTTLMQQLGEQIGLVCTIAVYGTVIPIVIGKFLLRGGEEGP